MAAVSISIQVSIVLYRLRITNVTSSSCNLRLPYAVYLIGKFSTCPNENTDKAAIRTAVSRTASEAFRRRNLLRRSADRGDQPAMCRAECRCLGFRNCCDAQCAELWCPALWKSPKPVSVQNAGGICEPAKTAAILIPVPNLSARSRFRSGLQRRISAMTAHISSPARRSNAKLGTPGARPSRHPAPEALLMNFSKNNISIEFVVRN